MKKLLLSLLTATLATGCYAEGSTGYGYTTVGVAGPNLVYVDGVQVVADSEYPVFYQDNLYWRYDGGVWYSSRYHDRGWGVTYNVPVAVRGVRSPEMYAHYRGGGGGNYRGNATYRGGGPVNRGPVVRDHRSAPAPARSAPSHPVVRDHRH